jgi:hypothetical protein
LPVLRLILGVLGLLLLAGAVIAARFGVPLPALLAPAGIGLVLLVGGMFERVHYKLLRQKAPGGGFVATPERFVDPASGRMVQVHVKPETGERIYVDTGPAPPRLPL